MALFPGPVTAASVGSSDCLQSYAMFQPVAGSRLLAHLASALSALFAAWLNYNTRKHSAQNIFMFFLCVFSGYTMGHQQPERMT